MRRLLARLPPRITRAAGRLQFRSPMIRRLTRPLAARLAKGEGTIAHGVGAGLRFDSTGGYPGYLLGTSEPLEQDLLRQHLSEGSVFYDIGANIGFFSTLAARLVGSSGSVWAFEPFPVSAERARRNAALNGFTHVTVIETAVSTGPGRAVLSAAGDSATHRLGLPDVPGLAVDVIGIDDWRDRHDAPAPTFVMIDVEGAELDVLDGMLGLLARDRPVVSCEVHWLGERFHEYVEARLKPLGYDAVVVDGDPAKVERWHVLLVPAG